MVEEQSKIEKETVKQVKWLVNNTTYSYSRIADKFERVTTGTCKDIKLQDSWRYIDSKKPDWFNTVEKWV